MNGYVIIPILGLLAEIQAASMQLNETGEIDCTRNDRATKMFPMVTDCRKYYQCAYGRKFVMNCPDGQHFNARLHICDDPNYAGCKVNVTQSLISSTLPPIRNNTESYIVSSSKDHNERANSTDKEPHISSTERAMNTEIPQNSTVTSTITNSTSLNQNNSSASNATGSITSNFTIKVTESSKEPVDTTNVMNITNTASTTNGSEVGKVVTQPNIAARNDSLTVAGETTLTNVTTAEEGNKEDVDKEDANSSTHGTSEEEDDDGDEEEDDKGNEKQTTVKKNI